MVGRSRGFGFVQFTRKEGAARCLQANGRHILDGRFVEVKPCDKDEQKPPEKPSVSPPKRSRSRSSPSIFRNRGKKKSPPKKSRSRDKSRSRSKSKSKAGGGQKDNGRKKSGSS